MAEISHEKLLQQGAHTHHCGSDISSCSGEYEASITAAFMSSMESQQSDVLTERDLDLQLIKMVARIGGKKVVETRIC